MDFRHLISLPAALADVACDALVLVVAGEAADAALDPRLAAALDDAVSSGDLALKKGKALYLHRPAGMKTARLVFAVAGSGSAKAFKAAVAQGLAQLKGLGAKHVAVGLAGVGELGAAHAEALVSAAAEATYVYRHTKPSAPAAGAMEKFTLLCSKADVKAVQQGLARGQAIASGVALARECANRPGNHCTPTYLANQAKKLGKEFGLKVDVLDRKAVEKLGMGSFVAVAQGSAEPLRFIVAEVRRRAQGPGAGGAGGQGNHFRHRRHLDQAGCRDGRDEVRHGWRRECAGHAARGVRVEAEAELGVHHPVVREHAQQQGGQAR